MENVEIDDPELADIKRIALRNLALAEDTNRMVHKMHRSVVWGRFFQFVWWGAIILASGAAYYYLQPYVGSIEKMYYQIEGVQQQTPHWGQNIQQFFGQFTSPKAQTTQ